MNKEQIWTWLMMFGRDWVEPDQWSRLTTSVVQIITWHGYGWLYQCKVNKGRFRLTEQALNKIGVGDD
jgi:hypothetical protein